MGRQNKKSRADGGQEESSSNCGYVFDDPTPKPTMDGEILQMEDKLISLYMKRRKASNLPTQKGLGLTTFDEDASLGDDDSVNSVVSFSPIAGIPNAIRPSLGGSFWAPLSPGLKPLFMSDDDGELFAQQISVRNKNKTAPSSHGINKVFESIRSLGNNVNRSIRNLHNENVDHKIDDSSACSSLSDAPVPKKQFMVKVVRERSVFKKILNLLNLSPDEYSYYPNQWVLSYINWTFRCNLTVIIISFTFGYFIMCVLFAVLLKIAGDANPECVIIGGEAYGTETSTSFSDAFHLSWTTFTTVGYGAAYPSTGNQHASQADCAFVTLLCTVESFCGLLYAGFCTAILFSKVQRVQSHAQVSFSNSICIQYGSPFDGAYNPSSNEGDSHRNIWPKNKMKKKSRLLCPVLKFQLVNDLANVPGGDILDARINVVGRKETTGAGATARYVKVRLVESGHPFFTRVWHVTHVLNKNSRLLSKETRAAITENDGFWPAHIVSHESLMNALVFDKIIITVTGICDLSATNVQIAKKYSHDDVMIGYDYAPMVYKEQETGKIKVDMDLKHDIVEQDGGPDEDENDIYRDKLRFQARDDLCQDNEGKKQSKPLTLTTHV